MRNGPSSASELQESLITTGEEPFLAAGSSAVRADEHAQRLRRSVRVVIYTSLAANVLLLLAKLVAFVASGSMSVLASLVDSVIDLVSQALVSWADWRMQRCGTAALRLTSWAARRALGLAPPAGASASAAPAPGPPTLTKLTSIEHKPSGTLLPAPARSTAPHSPFPPACAARTLVSPLGGPGWSLCLCWDAHLSCRWGRPAWFRSRHGSWRTASPDGCLSSTRQC